MIINLLTGSFYPSTLKAGSCSSSEALQAC